MVLLLAALLAACGVIAWWVPLICAALLLLLPAADDDRPGAARRAAVFRIRRDEFSSGDRQGSGHDVGRALLAVEHARRLAAGQGTPRRADAMKISYVTMVFPVPSEAFTSVEIAALRRRGEHVAVHALGPPVKNAAALLAEHGLSELPLRHGGLTNQLRGIFLCIIRPICFWELLTFALRYCRRKPQQMMMSLLCVPSSLKTFTAIQQESPDVVHLFWGHYPSLVGWLVLRHLPQVVVTTSLSAYDLRMRYGGSIPVARRAFKLRTWAAANVDELVELGLNRGKIQVINQGLDLTKCKEADSVDRVAHRIVSCGRLIGAKGMDDVLRVFRDVVEDWPDASLVVLGDGPELENDPGAANWLDTGGRRRGFVTVRWLDNPSAPPVEASVVPLARAGD